MKTQVGLFFPFIHFPSDDWIKVAALYWDQMARIVPGEYKPVRDTETVRILADEGHFVINDHPGWQDLKIVKENFKKSINSHHKDLVNSYGTGNQEDWPVNQYTERFAPFGANPKLAYIFDEKIEYELNKILIESDLGTRRGKEGDEYRWIGMHPKLVNVYMAALAEAMAVRRQIHPVAYDTPNYFAVSGFTFERLAQILLQDVQIAAETTRADEVEAGLANIAIKAVMPRNIDVVPVEKIIALREKHVSQMAKFQAFVQNISNDLPELEKIEVKEYVQLHLQKEYEKNIKPKMDELEDAINEVGIDAVTSVLNIEFKIPPLLLAGGVTLANPILGAGAAVAMGLLKVITDKRKAIEGSLRNSDVAYLLHIKEELEPVGTLDWLNTRARKLMFGG